MSSEAIAVQNGIALMQAGAAVLVPTIPAQGQATAFFAWNAPLSGVPALIEVLPVIPLP